MENKARILHYQGDIMANILIRGPLLTQSGYGVHSRQIFRWAKSRGHDVSVSLTPWGITPWYVNSLALSGMVGSIMQATNPASVKPDISFQIQLFQKLIMILVQN
jgi:hypothetical protein